MHWLNAWPDYAETDLRYDDGHTISLPKQIGHNDDLAAVPQKRRILYLFHMH
jgi:hypothetical protein